MPKLQDGFILSLLVDGRKSKSIIYKTLEEEAGHIR